MNLRDISEVLDAEALTPCSEELMQREYTVAFASDLMSDALAMIRHAHEDIFLLTGLCNPQVLRTAEMLDVQTIVFVRGKRPSEDVIELAEEMGFNIFRTEYNMYTACGKLYEKGIHGLDELDPA